MAAEHSPNPMPVIPSSAIPEPVSAPEAIARNLVVEESVRHVETLQALHAAVIRLHAIHDQEPLIENLRDAAVNLVRADDGLVLLTGENPNELHVASSRTRTPTTMKVDHGAVGQAVQFLQPLLLVGKRQIESCAPFLPEQASSCIVAPLSRPRERGGAEILGALVVIRRLGSPDLTSEDLRLVGAFSNQASIALHQARLYERKSRRAAQFENLVELSRSLRANLQVDQVLHVMVERAVELLGCQAGSVLLIDRVTQELVFKVAVGPAGRQLDDVRLPPGAGIAGVVARDGVPLIVNDAKADPRHYGEIDASTSLETRSLLCVPLTSNGEILGVVELMNKANGVPFEKEDCDLLTAFAIQGAIALENARLYSELRQAFTDTVQIIANAIEAHDPYTRGHTERVTQLALATAREMGWSRGQIETLEIGALLHDIGKIGISDAILSKPGGLTHDEYSEMMRHPVVGAKMLENVAGLRPMLPYVLYHQERYDGHGYPFGLKGDEIPLEGRILAVVDTFDAMTSNRPYRKGLSENEAIAEIERNRGTQFDPDVVDALLRVLQNRRSRV